MNGSAFSSPIKAHDITLFEANDYPGGHTNTVDAELDGERHAIDTGFIVFNDWTYPNFIALLDELGIATQLTSMSFSVRCDSANLEYNGSSLNGLFAQRRNLLRTSFYRMLADILRFNREAPKLVLSRAATDETTVGEFLARHRYSHEFALHYLLPIGAAIWSCQVGTFENFPIRFIVEFYKNHGLLSIRKRPTWRVIDGVRERMSQRWSSAFEIVSGSARQLIRFVVCGRNNRHYEQCVRVRIIELPHKLAAERR